MPLAATTPTHHIGPRELLRSPSPAPFTGPPPPCPCPRSPQALDFLGRDAAGQVRLEAPQWKEYFSEEAQRLYYCNDDIGYNSWDAPPCFKFGEWALDAQLYGIGLRAARDLYEVGAGDSGGVCVCVWR